MKRLTATLTPEQAKELRRLGLDHDYTIYVDNGIMKLKYSHHAAIPTEIQALLAQADPNAFEVYTPFFSGAFDRPSSALKPGIRARIRAPKGK